MAGRPREEGQRLEGVDDRRQRRVAVDEIAREQRDEPEGQRPGATHVRRRRERHAARGQHHEAIQEDLAEGGGDGDLVPWQRPEDLADAPQADGEDEHRDSQSGQVARQLLQGDHPAALGRGRQEVETAAGGLAGQGPGQGEDRPQPQEDRQRITDAPREEAAQSLQVDRLAEQASQRERQGRQGRDELVAKRDRGELRRCPVRSASPEHEQPGHHAHD